MMKKTLLFVVLFIFPLNVFAYSERLIASGENIGITLNTKGILIVGTYDVKGHSPAQEAGLSKGDLVTKVEGKEVSTIEQLASFIDAADQNEIQIEYKRNNKFHNTTLKLVNEDDILKTGLYVKDEISGIGTLTFIDPETKIFGALGHEILNQTTGKILEIKNGQILKSNVKNIIPSSKGNAGEKQAEYDAKNIEGNVLENTTQGIFGQYTTDINSEKTYKVAKISEIKTGKATLKTVLSGDKVSDYDIEITEIKNENSENKNFTFEIIDEKLLNKTGGIVQGMSGSPIIQGDFIVGAVTHVVVDNPSKGYGIFITNMLEEAEN